MTEAELHKMIVDYLQVALPSGSVVHHSPNEGRHKVAYRAKQKRLGMRAGWPDLEIFVQRTWWRDDTPWSPIFMEIKPPKGRVSPAQKAEHAELQAAGCAVNVVRSVEDVAQVLDSYLTTSSGGGDERTGI